MTKSIPLSEMKSATKIFADFINYNQKDNFDNIPNIISEIKKNNYDRKALINALKTTIPINDLSRKQKENLDLLSENNSLAVVSGQQAGFLGGSMYTLYKALDTVALSEKLSKLYPDSNFVPVFWIEDNDNDLAESSETFLFDIDNNPVRLALNFDKQTIVSCARINEESADVIKSAVDLISKLYPNGEAFSKLIESCYIQDSTWSGSFAKLLNGIIGETGILLISAEKLMGTKIFKDLITHEIQNSGLSKLNIEKTNTELLERGYHVQAAVSDVNLFYHIGEQRFRIDLSEGAYVINGKSYTKDELLDMAVSTPDMFSPKVLLRPLFQDFALPTVCYIGGPAEIAYQSQIVSLYDEFKIIKPAIIMRSSYTIIDRKVSRVLNKINRNPDYFFKSFSEIEKEIANELLGNKHEEIFKKFRNSFNDDFSIIREYLLDLDNQLERTINGSLAKINEQIDQLDKKAHSTIKRNNEELISRYKAVSNAIMPYYSPQERKISPLYYLSVSDNLIDLILNNNNLPTEYHEIIEA